MKGFTLCRHPELTLFPLSVTPEGCNPESSHRISGSNKQGFTLIELLVVVLIGTYQSSWVPFEIGMAAHKDLPTVTYLAQNVRLPEYLDFWPRIRYLEQLRFYVEERRSHERKMKMANESRCYSGVFRMDSVPTTEDFYSDLKRRLIMGR